MERLAAPGPRPNKKTTKWLNRTQVANADKALAERLFERKFDFFHVFGTTPEVDDKGPAAAGQFPAARQPSAGGATKKGDYVAPWDVDFPPKDGTARRSPFRRRWGTRGLREERCRRRRRSPTGSETPSCGAHRCRCRTGQDLSVLHSDPHGQSQPGQRPGQCGVRGPRRQARPRLRRSVHAHDHHPERIFPLRRRSKTARRPCRRPQAAPAGPQAGEDDDVSDSPVAQDQAEYPGGRRRVRDR